MNIAVEDRAIRCNRNVEASCLSNSQDVLSCDAGRWMKNSLAATRLHVRVGIYFVLVQMVTVVQRLFSPPNHKHERARKARFLLCPVVELSYVRPLRAVAAVLRYSRQKTIHHIRRQFRKQNRNAWRLEEFSHNKKRSLFGDLQTEKNELSYIHPKEFIHYSPIIAIEEQTMSSVTNDSGASGATNYTSCSSEPRMSMKRATALLQAVPTITKKMKSPEDRRQSLKIITDKLNEAMAMDLGLDWLVCTTPSSSSARRGNHHHQSTNTRSSSSHFASVNHGSSAPGSGPFNDDYGEEEPDGIGFEIDESNSLKTAYQLSRV